jgi:hypothetical protein
MKPWVVLYNNRRDQTYGDWSREMRVLSSTYPTGVWL